MWSPARESELCSSALLDDHPPWHQLGLNRSTSTAEERPPGISAEPPGDLLPSPYLFILLSPDDAPLPSPTPNESGNNNSNSILDGVGGVLVAAAVVLCALLVVCFYIGKKRFYISMKRKHSLSENDLRLGPLEYGQQNVPPPTAHNRPVSTEHIASPRIAANSSIPPLSRRNSIENLTGTFTYEELQKATDNFSDANFLGQGGFGKVHKGVLQDGKVVAIKQLKTGSHQGEREFKAEVDTISRVHHRHLVSLVGYCMSGTHKLLVYEFVPNRTLQFHLHEQIPAMTWPNRMKIALGSARGLAYLHEDCRPRIIHRDIKAANILIDDSFEAKVADFGLAKFFPDAETHVSTRVVGTFGYMDPEYASSGRVTEKSDIYSFGVLLLELITGRRPLDLVNWAKSSLAQALKDGTFYAFVDPNLVGQYDPTEMKRMVSCAITCVRTSAKDRQPMSQIARALEGIVALDLEDLNEGVISGQSRADSYPSSKYVSRQYKVDVENIFNKLVLEGREQGSNPFITAGDQTLSGPSTEGLPTTREM